MLFGVGLSCRILYYIICHLYVSCSESITSVEEERANLSAIVYLYLCGFSSERFTLHIGAWDGLRYLIVALPGLPYNYFPYEQCQMKTHYLHMGKQRRRSGSLVVTAQLFSAFGFAT